ncbi:exported protein of unknown function [Streptomyces sp. KY70]|nr:exported protein of unknown function [Streptomyces sp. KY70]
MPSRSSRTAVTVRSRSYASLLSSGVRANGRVALACTPNVPVVRPAGSIGPSRAVSRVIEVTCSPPSSTWAFRVNLTLVGARSTAYAATPGRDSMPAPAPAARLMCVAMRTPQGVRRLCRGLCAEPSTAAVEWEKGRRRPPGAEARTAQAEAADRGVLEPGGSSGRKCAARQRIVLNFLRGRSDEGVIM